MRVAPPRVFPVPARSPRPAVGTPGADTHRQTGFVLGGEVELVIEGLTLEGRIAEHLAGPKTRKQPVAAVLAHWSRGWLARLEALHGVETGNYVSALALIRAAADYAAADIAMVRTSGEEWVEWLEDGGLALAPAQHATEFRLHPFRSAEVLAGHEVLGRVYRGATDLALPHFGSTLLLAGSESDPNRVAVTFGDRDFHVGLAEIALGWLLELSAAQLTAVAEASELLPAQSFGPAVSAFAAGASQAVNRHDRCRIEAIDVDGLPRVIVQNFRRTPSSAPGRVLL